MQIFRIQNYNNYNYNQFKQSKSYEQTPSFKAKGKPLSTEAIIKKHADLIPQRVINLAQEYIKKGQEISLLDLHKEAYTPLLEFTSIEELKKHYPEFKDIKNELIFKNNTKGAISFKEKFGNDFSLKMIKEYWAKLKSKDEIVEEYKLTNRSTLNYALDIINFFGLSNSYKTLLKASDEEGCRIIAERTKAWNKLNPELRRELNKHAAQSCKTKEFQEKQRNMMLEYDKNNPQRREKISNSLTERWKERQDIKDAMSEFAKNESEFIRYIFMKKASKQPLTLEEKITYKSFWKRFWDSHPHLKKQK